MQVTVSVLTVIHSEEFAHFFVCLLYFSVLSILGVLAEGESGTHTALTPLRQHRGSNITL